MAGPTGYKVVRVNMDNKKVSDFIHNTENVPGHRLKPANALALERPIDVKYNPVDNCLYILDFGQMRMRGGKMEVTAETGKIYRLVPKNVAATLPN
jgi:hypothetical protein